MTELRRAAARLLAAVDRAAQAEASAARRQHGAQHPSTRATLLTELNEARRELRPLVEDTDG